MFRTSYVIACLTLLAFSDVRASILYWDATTAAGAVSTGVADGDGKWTSASVFPDGWSTSSAVSTVRNNVGAFARTRAALNSTAGQAGFAEIEFNLPATGYWTIEATQTTASLGTGAKTVTSLAGWVGLPATTTIFSTGNVWNSMGTYLSNTTTPKFRFDENNNTTNRWYLDQMRLTSATPVAATNAGPADGSIDIPTTGAGNNLAWGAGNFSSTYDLLFDTSPTPTTTVATGLTGTTFDPDGLGLTDGTTYYWRVVGNNVDNSTNSSIFSFTTAGAPEPASLGLLMTAGLLLRRRRA